LSLKNGIVVALLIHFSCVNTFVPHPLVSAGGCLNKIHQSTQHPQNNFFLQTNRPPKPKGKERRTSAKLKGINNPDNYFIFHK
jgi:hypothetical protein